MLFRSYPGGHFDALIERHGRGHPCHDHQAMGFTSGCTTCVPVPGTLLVWKTVVIGIHDRTGLVVAVHPCGQVDVVWSDWVKEDIDTMTDARHRFWVRRMQKRRAEGKARRQDKWEQKRAARQLMIETKVSSSSAGTST